MLQQFAIDPDRIAIMGTCATGRVPVNIGGDNFEVFNRIISLSGAPSSFDEVDPPTPKVEFFFDAGIDGLFSDWTTTAVQARRAWAQR